MGTHDDSPTDERSADPPDTTTYRCGPDELPTEGVLLTVAAVTGAEPTRMEPLSETVDPDALNALFRISGETTRDAHATHVRFRYQDCIVTVHADGRTVVSRTDFD